MVCNFLLADCVLIDIDSHSSSLTFWYIQEMVLIFHGRHHVQLPVRSVLIVELDVLVQVLDKLLQTLDIAVRQVLVLYDAIQSLTVRVFVDHVSHTDLNSVVFQQLHILAEDILCAFI